MVGFVVVLVGGILRRARWWHALLAALAVVPIAELAAMLSLSLVGLVTASVPFRTWVVVTVVIELVVAGLVVRGLRPASERD